MKKTINVTIGGLVFSVEEDGYMKLHHYLESLKTHFSVLSYGSEIIADIESRIAEQLNAKTGGNAQRAVTLTDVDEVLKVIGSVEDFDSHDSGYKSATNRENAASPKRLYRSSDDVMIAGVAAGIAAYFGIDTLIVRILFIIIFLAGGWGILLYIILWLLLPEAKTAGQKLEMKGAPVTLKQFEQTAKEKISEVRKAGTGRKILNVIAKIIRVFMRIILGIIGVAVTFGAAVASFAVTFSFANFLFNRNSPYMDFPVGSVFHGGEYFLALVLIFIAVIIPLFYLALGGLTLIRLKKPPVNGMLATVLAVVWTVAAIGVGVFAIKKGPDIQAAVAEYQGNVETRTVSASNFSKLDASSAYKLNVNPGKDYAVTITGHTRDLDTSKIGVENGVLVLDQKSKFCFFCFDNEVSVNVTMPSLESIKGSGATDFTVGKFSSPNFNLELSGASDATISDLTATETKIKLSGASDLTVTGTSKLLNAQASGASEIKAYDFAVQDATVKVSGASHAEINAGKTLNADASGASTVLYRGKPTLTQDDESGSSRIRPE
jgi:phage shock protein PspC (stress-responsive transcriptional regulator)